MKDLFEGVYLKHQKNGESICFIAGRAGETRFVQVITNGTVRQYDGAQGFCFGEEGVAAELPGVQGALRYGPTSWGRSAFCRCSAATAYTAWRTRWRAGSRWTADSST